MAFASMDHFLEKWLGKNREEVATKTVEQFEQEYEEAKRKVESNSELQAYRQQLNQAQCDAMRNQQYGMQDPSGFQNAIAQRNTLTAQEIAMKQQQTQMRVLQMQAEYDQKFREEAYIKGAVSSEELDSVAYSLSLEEVRTIWLAAFGSRWVAQESMEGDHRLMFQRLQANNEFESATVTDPSTRTFKIRYRLRGT